MKTIIILSSILFLSLTLQSQNLNSKKMLNEEKSRQAGKKTFILVHGSWHSA